MIMPRGQQLLLPANPLFIAASLFLALVVVTLLQPGQQSQRQAGRQTQTTEETARTATGTHVSRFRGHLNPIQAQLQALLETSRDDQSGLRLAQLGPLPLVQRQ